MADKEMKPALLSGWRLFAVAGLLGALVGSGALYFSLSKDGNQAVVVADSCAAKTAQSKAVGALATGSVAGMAAIEPRSLAGLRFQGENKAPITLADFKGKTLLLNLWATWCAPCRAEMPELDALQAEKGSDSFEVVALNLDRGKDTKPEDFYTETGIKSLKHYRDGTLGVFNDLKSAGLVLGLPVTMLIDGEGCLLAAMNGPAPWHSEDAKRFIDGVLAIKD
ncbi:MAG: thiol:disulfide interchange protein TlpA [Notoacmeibacter sp.]